MNLLTFELWRRFGLQHIPCKPTIHALLQLWKSCGIYLIRLRPPSTLLPPTLVVYEIRTQLKQVVLYPSSRHPVVFFVGMRRGCELWCLGGCDSNERLKGKMENLVEDRHACKTTRASLPFPHFILLPRLCLPNQDALLSSFLPCFSRSLFSPSTTQPTSGFLFADRLS
jgi:hypothetical protein